VLKGGKRTEQRSQSERCKREQSGERRGDKLIRITGKIEQSSSGEWAHVLLFSQGQIRK
jgi:hypothetical protein